MLNVIIVDDELLMRIGLKSMIDWEALGFRIVGEAANGKEAMELAARHATDLIITDIKMPVMDGLELIRAASGQHESCKFVILSCMDEFQYAQEALRLGAVDYLIKSELKQEQLLRVLERVRNRALQVPPEPDRRMFDTQYKEGIGYLRETLFKEMFSGFRGEKDMLELGEELQISLEHGEMLVAKLRVSRFHHIRRKYVEQDEKLLRYSIVNIMEEIIPRKWRKEIVVENSADYLLILNVPEDDRMALRGTMDGLLGKIRTAMKDFLNIAISVGVSGIASGFGGLRKAYREADAALGNLFFEPYEQVLYFDSPAGSAARDSKSFGMTREETSAFRRSVEDGRAEAELVRLKARLYAEEVSEEGCRKTYLRLLSVIASCYPSVPELLMEGLTPYEHMLQEERLEGLNAIAVQFIRQCARHNEELLPDPLDYAEQARAIVLERYAQDISLQAVAGLINVNPSYLSRVFKEKTGENFIGFLTRIRIEKARQLLKNKSYKVYEVASMTGYPNTGYFSKLFKKVTGVTPEEFRG